MSNGAAARGVAGVAAGAPRRGCASGAVTNAALAANPSPQINEYRSARFMSISADSMRAHAASIESLALEAPAEPVGRPQQAAHADAVVDGIAPRITGDDDLVAGLQRLARDALAR